MTTAIAWHADLPRCPLPTESSEQLGENHVEFNPDLGPPMRRARSTIAYDRVRLAFMMTWTQTQIFRDFYRNTLLHGTMAFVLQADPFTRESAEYNFASPPEFQRVSSNAFRVIFDALRRPV